MKRRFLSELFKLKLDAPRSRTSTIRKKSRLAISLRCERLEDRRLLAAGVLDTGFGTAGKVTTPVAGSELLLSIAVQPNDGKIVAVGVSDNSADGQFAVMRYNSNGSLDNTFGVGGQVAVNFVSGNDTANDVAIQPDGKIVVVGRVSSGGLDSAIMRLNTNGSLDSSFGVGGKIIVPVNPTQTDFFSSVAIDSSGRIVVSGSVYSATTLLDITVSRFLPNGSADTSFNGTGRATIDFQTPLSGSNFDYGESVMIDSAGRIVVGGHTTSNSSAGGSSFALTRLLPSGVLDTTFDGDGRATASLTGLLGNTSTATTGFSVAAQADGKLIIAGGHDSKFALARFDASGSLDALFGSGGKVLSVLPGTNTSRAQFVDIQTNGKIVAVGYAYSNTQRFFAVSRYNSNGSQDTTFDGDGVALTSFTPGNSASDQALAGALQEDGKIIVAGHVGNSGATDFALARFQGDPVPVNAGGPYFVSEGGSVTLNGIAPDIAPPPPSFAWDLDGDNVYGEIGAGASRGDEIGANPTFIPVGLEGPMSVVVSLRVTDVGQPDQFDTAIIHVVNFAPIAGNDAASTDEEQMVTIAVLDNDSDVAGVLDPLTIISVSGTTKGVATIDNNSGVIHYLPNINATGVDTFSYTISDGDGGEATANVEVTIHNLVDFSGRVFLDANNDGSFSLLDGDVGLDGVSVNVIDKATMQVVFSDVSNTDGSYMLNSNLHGGMYQLVENSSFRSTTSLLDGKESAGNLGGTVDNATDSDSIDQIEIDGNVQLVDAVDYLFGNIEPSTLMGFVWKDFNADNLIDFNEQAIGGVQIELSGVDDRGTLVTGIFDVTDIDGAYAFLNLRPGTYAVSEYQPAGFTDGAETLGTVNGLPSGVVANDRFTGIQIPLPGSTGQNYNFGERPQSSGSVANSGQSASIGFWQNKNGRNLLRSLNGGANATQLGHWLAATFPNMYGASAGINNLAGKTNQEVANFYELIFMRNKKTAAGGGPPKVDAQVLATALAVYVTNSNLAGNAASSFGFNVTADGLGTRIFNVGSKGAAFGVANHTQVQVLDLLLAVNARSANGLLFDMTADGDTNDTNETLYREMANDVFESINDAGRL